MNKPKTLQRCENLVGAQLYVMWASEKSCHVIKCPFCKKRHNVNVGTNEREVCVSYEIILERLTEEGVMAHMARECDLRQGNRDFRRQCRTMRKALVREDCEVISMKSFD